MLLLNRLLYCRQLFRVSAEYFFPKNIQTVLPDQAKCSLIVILLKTLYSKCLRKDMNLGRACHSPKYSLILPQFMLWGVPALMVA